MQTNWIKGAAAVSLLGLTGIASAQTPLELGYDVTDLGGGVFQYDFVLVNTNTSGTWSAGQNFDWIIFGDAAGGPSNLTGFVGDPGSLTGTPWADEGFTSSSGGHNGPTLLDFNNGLLGWVPGFVGDSVSWSGTSTANLGQGELLWSNLVGSGVHADFAVATLVPVPASSLMLGVAGLAIIRRRR